MARCLLGLAVVPVVCLLRDVAPEAQAAKCLVDPSHTTDEDTIGWPASPSEGASCK